MRVTNLENTYKKEILPALIKELGVENVMQVPRIEKITLNVCMSEAVKNAKLLETARDELTAIAGQKAVITRAKKAIANFKLREGMPIGTKVTLRREKMWVFLEKLMHITIPRVRDFRGLSPKGFDGRGNYNMGLKEQIVFPEVDYDKIDLVRGMNISIGTTAKTDAEGKALLEALGFPFRK
jgi:large subunit ribosomal protein L5